MHSSGGGGGGGGGATDEARLILVHCRGCCLREVVCATFDVLSFLRMLFRDRFTSSFVEFTQSCGPASFSPQEGVGVRGDIHMTSQFIGEKRSPVALFVELLQSLVEQLLVS